MASIAIADDVDVVAAKADEGDIFAFHVQGNRRGIESDLDA